LPYIRDGRQAGTSQYTFRKLLSLAADGVLCLSQTPLRLIGWLGALATTATLALGLALSLGGISASPLLWAGLALGSVQLLCLGILAQYLGRVYDEVRGRPRWVVAATIGIRASKTSIHGRRRKLQRELVREPQ
jgi:dolichol-phosphate mannosyltransferase